MLKAECPGPITVAARGSFTKLGDRPLCCNGGGTLKQILQEHVLCSTLHAVCGVPEPVRGGGCSAWVLAPAGCNWCTCTATQPQVCTAWLHASYDASTARLQPHACPRLVAFAARSMAPALTVARVFCVDGPAALEISCTHVLVSGRTLLLGVDLRLRDCACITQMLRSLGQRRATFSPTFSSRPQVGHVFASKACM